MAAFLNLYEVKLEYTGSGKWHTWNGTEAVDRDVFALGVPRVLSCRMTREGEAFCLIAAHNEHQASAIAVDYANNLKG